MHHHNHYHQYYHHKTTTNRFNRMNNDEHKYHPIINNGCHIKPNVNNRFSESIQRKCFNINDENTDTDLVSLCSTSLSNSFSSMNTCSSNDNKNNSSFDDVTAFSSSSSSSSSSLSNSLSSSSSSLSSCISSAPVWTSALYSPCLHSNLFKSWSTNLLEMQQYSSLYSKQIDENGDYYYTDESSSSSSSSSCTTGRGFSLSSYSLDSKNSKKIEDFLSSQSSENSFNESFSDYRNRSSYDMQDDENGQLLASYQEMNSKINDLINCNENSKNAASKRPELLEITNKTKNNSRVNDFNNNIHVNTSNEHDNDNSSKSISPKPKFIAPRFEKKWLENQNNSMMNVNHHYNHHHYYNNNNNNQQQSPPPNFIEYSPKCQTFLKQINFNDNFKTTLTSKQNVLKATNSYETNIIKPNANNNCNNNKKTYQKQANQYFKRSSNNLNKTNNNKYLNQKTMSKRSYQCKCLNNNKCTCYSTVTVNSNNSVQYTNENDFYLNRNIVSYNNVNNYNYIQAQNISNTTITTNTTTNNNNNNPNNQNRFRYTAKSRA